MNKNNQHSSISEGKKTTVINHLFNHAARIIPQQYFQILINRLDKNTRHIRKLKNIHKGRRAFIIGSGPSLQISDLDRLKNEITFACNKIYLAFEATAWRPTYYTILDRLVAENCNRIVNTLPLKKIFTSEVTPYFQNIKDINWLKALPSPTIDGKRQYRFSTDISKCVFEGMTVIYTMMQIAFYMGIRELYIIGLDFSFSKSKQTGEKTLAGEIILESEGEVNHFHADYRKAGETWTMPQLDCQYEAFKIAKQIFKEAGGIIYNASLKTKLDVFPLINFDDVINS